MSVAMKNCSFEIMISKRKQPEPDVLKNKRAIENFTSLFSCSDGFILAIAYLNVFYRIGCSDS